MWGPVGESCLSYGYVQGNPVELHLRGCRHPRHPLIALAGCQHLWQCGGSVGSRVCYHVSIVVVGVLESHYYDEEEGG